MTCEQQNVQLFLIFIGAEQEPTPNSPSPLSVGEPPHTQRHCPQRVTWTIWVAVAGLESELYSNHKHHMFTFSLH